MMKGDAVEKGDPAEAAMKTQQALASLTLKDTKLSPPSE
jgi:hypothetical protein